MINPQINKLQYITKNNTNTNYYNKDKKIKDYVYMARIKLAFYF